ncbi:MAG: sigma factor-like helix-turn-helix DNA-binding protein [Prochloraceae cyanobacterium]|nr:sigma factor-like helix-turn-helix DNA-binding protein [Prochloraceae cyanobacterium]
MARPGRPKKYEDPYGKQKAYFQTAKGKAALKKYESSEQRKEQKRNWARKNISKTTSDRKQYFIDTYGDIEAALKLLDKRTRYIMIHLYGLDGSEPMTQEAIGKELFLSGSRIGQIKDDALDTLEPLKKAPESDESQT